MSATSLKVVAPEAKVGLVANFSFAPWNPNEMENETYALLKDDMRIHGPNGIGPIVACPRSILDPKEKDQEKLIVCDGNQRLKAAVELGWKEIRYFVETSIKTEEDARTYTIRNTTERGRANPMKVAENYGWFAERGHKQEEIAKRFGVSQEKVSRALSTLRVVPEVREKMVHDVRLGQSHLEAVATLKTAELQKQAASAIFNDSGFKESKPGPGEKVSVRFVEAKVRQVQDEADARKGFQDIIAQAKFKACPTDGRPARFDPSHNYAKDPKPLLLCDSLASFWEHRWDPKTGEQPNLPKHTPPTSIAGHLPEKIESQKAEAFPDYLRTTHTVEEFKAASAAKLKEIVGPLVSIQEANITGKTKDGVVVQFDVRTDWVRGDVTISSVEATGRTYIRVEKKSYDAEKLKDYHALLRGPGQIKNAAQAATVEKAAEAFLKKYLPRGLLVEKPAKKAGPKAAGKKK